MVKTSQKLQPLFFVADEVFEGVPGEAVEENQHGLLEIPFEGNDLAGDLVEGDAEAQEHLQHVDGLAVQNPIGTGLRKMLR